VVGTAVVAVVVGSAVVATVVVVVVGSARVTSVVSASADTHSRERTRIRISHGSGLRARVMIV